MAIDPISNGDTGAQLRAKINAAIADVNADIPATSERPGDAPKAFGPTLVGDGDVLPYPPAGSEVVTTDGSVRRVNGDATVASRQNRALEPGVTYVARWAVRRAVDSIDPAGDAVEFRIAWLNAAKQLISTQNVHTTTPIVVTGRVSFTATISADQVTDIVAPAGTKYWRPYVKTNGAAATLTDIEVIDGWRSNGAPGPQGNDGDLTPEAEALRDEMLDIKSAVEAAVGKKFGRNVLDYGADNTGTVLTQDEIQAALNAAGAAGGGMVFLPAGTYLIGKSAEVYSSTYVPPGSDTYYGLIIPSGVVLVGEGRSTVLKRSIADPLMVIICPNGYGTQVRNLLINGNATTYPYVGDTYGSGGGIGVESTTVTEDRETVIDTVWIVDTPGYGIGVEWGNHRGCMLRNIFINGTGSDGIDIKRMNSGGFDAFGIVLDTIHVTNFGRTATDGAPQAGVDIRGYVTATNIHVWGAWGVQGAAGIRMHADGGGVIGANFASVTNFYIERTSGGVATTYGALNNGARYGSFNNGSSRGCSQNFSANGTGAIFSNCRSVGATAIGFADNDGADGSKYIACSAEGTVTGFYVAGDNANLVSPQIVGHATGILIAGTAGNTSIIYPTYSGNTTDLNNSGVATSVLTNTSIGGGPGPTLQIDVSTTGGAWLSALRGSGIAALNAAGTDTDIDISFGPKGAGYHQFGNAKTQTTVGAAGGASALPATPTGYLRVKVSGTIRKIPFYADA